VRVFEVLVPLVLYLGLVSMVFMGVESTPIKALWFGLTISSLVAYAFMVRLRKTPSIYIIILISLLISGISGLSGLRWLHPLYLPYLVLVGAIFPLRILLISIFILPVFEIGHLFKRDILIEEIFFLLIAALTGLLSYFLLGRAVREKERLSASLRLLKESAMESLGAESLIKRGVSLNIEADSEIDSVLNSLRSAFKPDSVSLFVPYLGGLTLRRSVGSEGLNITEKGLIHIVFARKEAILINNTDMRLFNAGYTKSERIISLCAVPVLDGGFCLGVLVMDSSKPNAFGENSVPTLQSSARVIAGILKKQRVYAEMERSELGLKLLHERSARLLGSLRLKDISREILEGVEAIAVSSESDKRATALFLNTTEGLELIGERGLSLTKRIYSQKDTLLDAALRGSSHLYIPDLSGYSISALPIRTKAESAFYLPLCYESDVIGIVAVVFSRINPLTPHQIELLDVFGNQASTSLKNSLLHSKIEVMATTDGLTGLFNHRQFQERLLEEFKRQNRYGSPISLLIIDLDFFKKINDTYGHPVGDLVLRGTADIIRGTVREVDMAARYGGEEFAALLIGTDKKGAIQTAERLRRAIESCEFRADGKKIRVTSSIGVASSPPDANTKEDLIEKADKALYKAKADGRNKVVGWSDSLSGITIKKNK